VQEPQIHNLINCLRRALHSNKENPLNSLAKSFKYFLLGMLFFPVLINFIGFVGPFLSHFTHGKDSEHYSDLLNIFRLILPFFSLYFLLGAYHLSKLTGILGKSILLFSATLVVLTNTLKIIYPGSISHWLTVFSFVFEFTLICSILFVTQKFCQSRDQVQVAV